MYISILIVSLLALQHVVVRGEARQDDAAKTSTWTRSSLQPEVQPNRLTTAPIYSIEIDETAAGEPESSTTEEVGTTRAPTGLHSIPIEVTGSPDLARAILQPTTASPSRLTTAQIYSIEVETSTESAGITTTEISTTTSEPPTGRPERKPDERYAVVVDCGSSGTRARIYHWPADVSRGELARRIEPLRDGLTGRILSLHIRPGLTVVKDNPEAASDYMAPIMRFASQHVPEDSQAGSPIYFLGTAGMRLLSDVQQKSILEDIARDVRDEYNFIEIHTEVISGNKEGSYLWLSANLEAGRMGPNFDQLQGLNFHFQPKRWRRYGVIEMGGASAQVTFEASPKLEQSISARLRPSPEALQAYRNSRTSYALVGESAGSKSETRNFSLVSVTFLGFGSNSARGLAVDLLVRTASSQSTSWAGSSLLVEDPCLPFGSQQVMLKPLELVYGQSLRTIGYSLTAGWPSTRAFLVRLIGRGNHLLCTRLLRGVLQLAKEERTNCINREVSPERPCKSALIGASFVPWRQMQFLGLSELYYTTHEMMDQAGRFRGPTVQFEATRICATPYETLRGQYPESDREDAQRTLMECFKASWVLVWLREGLLMPTDSLVDLETVSRLEPAPGGHSGQELDWSLGALIERLSGE